MNHLLVLRQSLWRTLAVAISLLALSGAYSALPAQTDPFCCTEFNMQLTITPQPSLPGECCLRIEGLQQAVCSPNYYSIEIERYSFGNWISVPPSAPPTIQAALGRFTVDICIPEGYHNLMLKFYDLDGNLVCAREVVYNCGSVNCCDNFAITGSPGQSTADNCCFTIGGTIPESCGEVQWEIQEPSGGGGWAPIPEAGGSGTADQYNRSVSANVCRPRANGPFTFQIVLTDVFGNVICTQTLTYDCNDHACCQGFQFQATPAPSSIPNECCYTLEGVKNAACTFSTLYDIQENTGSGWTSILGGFQNFTGADFAHTVCLPTGTTTTYRAVLATSTNPNDVYCVKEITLDCPPSCCDDISIWVSQPIAGMDGCCFNMAVGTPGCLGEGTFVISEMDINGNWHVRGAPVEFAPGFNMQYMPYCLEYNAMPARVRFDFYDETGTLLCRREITVECPSDNCCDQMTGTITSANNPNECCFNITLNLPPCMPTCTMGISEMDWRGRWRSMPVAAIPYNGGQTVNLLNYCFTHDGMPARIRFEFYDLNGLLICTYELSADCYYQNGGDPGGSTGPGKLGAPGDVDMPEIIRYLSAAPNPASDEATISYTLSETAEVSVELVDVLGQRITLRQPATQAYGVHTLPFKTAGLPNGMYTIVVKANGTQTTMNIVIAR